MAVDLGNDADMTMGRRLKSIFGGSIGNLIEWYDFYVYNSFAVYFAKLFSASNDPTAQFINVFGIYAIGFLIRPVGGLILGYYADRAGRRAALTLSVMLMCVGSALIAILPSLRADRRLGACAPVVRPPAAGHFARRRIRVLRHLSQRNGRIEAPRLL